MALTPAKEDDETGANFLLIKKHIPYAVACGSFRLAKHWHS
jgi:hypothetical protein